MTQRNKKTVQQVLNRAHLVVNIPAMLIMSGCFLSFLIVDSLSLLAIFFMIFDVVVFPWLWWSFSVPKWRVWAFENVAKEDWVELRDKAVFQKVIWEEGHLFEKTEIRTKSDKQKIAKINAEINDVLNGEMVG